MHRVLPIVLISNPTCSCTTDSVDVFCDTSKKVLSKNSFVLDRKVFSLQESKGQCSSLPLTCSVAFPSQLTSLCFWFSLLPMCLCFLFGLQVLSDRNSLPQHVCILPGNMGSQSQFTPLRASIIQVNNKGL